MKFIHKRKEPRAWKDYRTTEGVVFRAIDELQNALLEDQGYLCCYCMSQIKKENMKVEHWKPRRYTSFIFDFDNLFAACKGDFCTDFHCDTKKADDEITIHPADSKNNCENIIDYSLATGKLTFPEAYQKDIEITLNLNNNILIFNRLAATNAVLTVLKTKGFSKSFIEKQIEKFENTNSSGQFQPYCQIVLKLLRKKLNSV